GTDVVIVTLPPPWVGVGVGVVVGVGVGVGLPVGVGVGLVGVGVGVPDSCDWMPASICCFCALAAVLYWLSSRSYVSSPFSSQYVQPIAGRAPMNATRLLNHWPCEPAAVLERSAASFRVPNSPTQSGAVLPS